MQQNTSSELEFRSLGRREPFPESVPEHVQRATRSLAQRLELFLPDVQILVNSSFTALELPTGKLVIEHPRALSSLVSSGVNGHRQFRDDLGDKAARAERVIAKVLNLATGDKVDLTKVTIPDEERVFGGWFAEDEEGMPLGIFYCPIGA